MTKLIQATNTTRVVPLAGTLLLALAASVGAAFAMTFAFTGALLDFTAPSAGAYDITAIGGHGGGGGFGAEVSGDLTLTAGEMLTIAVGAALPLFASGLGAMGLLGWRRKRKAQAAA